MAAKAIWSGSISFGLVNIPIRLYPATESHQLTFHQFDSKTHKRIRYQRVVEGTDREVPYDDIVDGYEVRKGEIVFLTDEEMEAAEPKKSRSLDIEQFVPLEDIDPIAWNRTYYVAPEAGAGPQKAYAVLRDAMTQMKRVAVGRLVMRTKQYLATLRPLDKGLALETMFFADEIRDFAAIGGAAVSGSGSAREVAMAKKLIEAFAETWQHDKYKDTYRDQLLSIIKKKAKGQNIEAPPAPAAGGKVIDLMEALKLSLGKGSRTGASTNAKESPAPPPPVAAKGRHTRDTPKRTGTPRSTTRKPRRKVA